MYNPDPNETQDERNARLTRENDEYYGGPVKRQRRGKGPVGRPPEIKQSLDVLPDSALPAAALLNEERAARLDMERARRSANATRARADEKERLARAYAQRYDAVVHLWKLALEREAPNDPLS
jgi:hypothetical protein